MRALLFTFLLISSVFANSYWQLALDKKLYEQSYWNLLLHNVDGTSEIDDKAFFLAQDGKHNAQAEMKATLNSLLHEIHRDDNAANCRFPARKRYLQESLSIPDSAFPDVACTEYESVKKRLKPTSATLVFPSGHKNSPATMFGHSFIRLDSKNKSKLLSYAVNYAAYTDEKNGFVYAMGGLFGLYQGRYSLLPYHEKIKEYVYTEQRDIWEYDLNLSPDETMRMFEHIWETNRVFSYYYFFTENCSYNLLWFLEIARPGVNLRDYFYYQVIPIETVFAINDEKLITKTHYRPSRYKKIKVLSKQLNDKEQSLAIDIANGNLKAADLNISNVQKKRYILETAVEYFQYQNSQAALKKGTHYRKQFLSILRERSKLGKGEPLDIKTPVNPLKGHRSVSMTLSSGMRNDESFQTFSFRPSFHDLTDNDDGFIKGTHIEFFNTTVSRYQNKSRFESIDIIAIESFSPRDAFFKPVSWRVKVGANRAFKDDTIRPMFTIGAGLNWENDHALIYMTTDFKSYYKNRAYTGVSASFGSIWYQAKALKMVFESSYTYYDDGFHQRINQVSENLTLGQNHMLSLSYEDIEKVVNSDEKIMLNYRYYY